jgi:hypothetical protein
MNALLILKLASLVDAADDTGALHLLNFSSVVSRSVVWYSDSALPTLKRVLLGGTVSSS